MILCETTIHSQMAPTRAFDYLADMTNTAEWHPSILESHLLHGHAGLRGAAYGMVAAVGPMRLPTRVQVVELARPHRFAYIATTRLHRSRHEITFSPRAGGVEVRTESRFSVITAISWALPLFRRYLTRYCNRSAASLHATLGSQLAPGPTWIPGGVGRAHTGSR